MKAKEEKKAETQEGVDRKTNEIEDEESNNKEDQPKAEENKKKERVDVEEMKENEAVKGTKQQGKEDGKSFKLAKHPSCVDDVKQLCQALPKENNFGILVCLQDAAAVSALNHIFAMHLKGSTSMKLKKQDRLDNLQKIKILMADNDKCDPY